MASNLKGKKILLGICGSIAAYKTAFLTRLLIKEGAEVKVIMTKAAATFITPLTLSTLSKNPVLTDISTEEAWNNHVELGLWADAFLIAPITANTLSKMATGMADNMLMACYLSAKCPVFFAPAMDLDMWKHPSTKKNLETLRSYGNKLIPVDHGELASGLVGEGRMADPEQIVTLLNKRFVNNDQFVGKTVLVTAGPTYEAIDPVRFIGNRSTGKMGIAIAEAFAERGADVKLILGPSALQVEHHSIQRIDVTSAEEMFKKAMEFFPLSQVAILAAAVADYRPLHISDKKIKKKEGNLNIELERTKDIAATLGGMKKENQIIVGFALETNNEEANAKRKLEKKNFDFIVLNSLKDKGAGFKHDTNKVSIISKHNETKKFDLKLKTEVAIDIVNTVATQINK